MGEILFEMFNSIDFQSLKQGNITKSLKEAHEYAKSKKMQYMARQELRKYTIGTSNA